MSAEELRAKLEEEILEASWYALKPHAERGSLILVKQPLSLPDAGLALAYDDSKTVEGWLGEGLLYKPSPALIEAWDKDETMWFSMAIVQPFVLAQELTPEHTQALLNGEQGS